MAPPAGPSGIPVRAGPVRRRALRAGAWAEGSRDVAEETAVAMTYNRVTHAVMMATPDDLADFATGFSLTEGIIGQAADIEELEVVAVPAGIELRMWVGARHMDVLDRRRRSLAGPTGCGLCGLDSLAQATLPPPAVRSGLQVTGAEVQRAVAALRTAQPLNDVTRAVHGAAFWRADGLVAAREDVGRHNALDKLVGALARAGVDGATGLLVMTSRISVELVQKAARLGTGILVAVSAPTALALRMADAAGLTLVGIARDDGFEVFTHPGRILD